MFVPLCPLAPFDYPVTGLAVHMWLARVTNVLHRRVLVGTNFEAAFISIMNVTAFEVVFLGKGSVLNHASRHQHSVNHGLVDIKKLAIPLTVLGMIRRAACRLTGCEVKRSS